MKRARLFLGVASIFVATGCSPTLFPISSAPPEREGSIRGMVEGTDENIIHLSKGVALALECRSEWDFEACQKMAITSREPKIARVMPAHIDKYRTPWGTTEWFDADKSHRGAFVVMGVESGETDIELTSSEGNRAYHVIVDP